MDRYERELFNLEKRVMSIKGVEALVQAAYIPGRPGGDVALSFNQGHERGGMDPRIMSEFLGIVINTMMEYRKTLTPFTDRPFPIGKKN